MTMWKLSSAVALLATLLSAKDASAANACVFYASDSIYYNASSESGSVYAYGPVSFVWEQATGRILGGYYPERVTYHSPVETYFSNITSGSISGSIAPALSLSIPLMSFSRSFPDSYSFALQSGTLTGTSSAAIFQGYLDGPYLIKATGIVNCY